MSRLLSIPSTGFVSGFLTALLILVIGGALFLSGGAAVQAGTPVRDEPPPPVEPAGPAAGLELMPGLPAAATADRISIQGRLTDAAGTPLNGNYTVYFRLYSQAEGGSPLCTNVLNPVSVINGLFSHTIDLCALSNAITGEQRYLGVQVGSDPEMTPRQPIFNALSAMTVRPGARIKGADTSIFVPGAAFIKNKSDDTTVWEVAGASVLLEAGATPGVKQIRIPISVPAVLMGQPVRVKEIRVYYVCENGANSYISGTELYKMTDAASWDSLASNTTLRQSNTATSYTLTADATKNTLSLTQGFLSVRIALTFGNTTTAIQIGGVRVTLEQDY